MRQEWWHIYVNDELLVSVLGHDTAFWSLNYLKGDTTNSYSMTRSKKEKARTKDIEPVRLQDIIDNANNN
tara:strand:+ start:182 stop:391 length:210 start_codon:yes stop_codon:yes gene_type:complete